MKKLIKAGTTSKLEEVVMRDSSTGQPKSGVLYSGVTVTQIINGAASATTPTAVTASLGAWTSMGWIEFGSTGAYQFGVPNAGLAGGAGITGVTFLFSASGCITQKIEYQFEAIDRQDATRMGLAGLPNATPGATGGLLIAGSNAATTISTLTVTGPVSIGGTLGVTGSVVFNSSFTIGSNMTIGGTFEVVDDLNIDGALNLGDVAIGGNVHVTGTWTQTGVATYTAGIVANITGNLSGAVGSVTGAVGSVVGLTSTRLGYIDNLAGGAVATFSQVAGLNFNAANFAVPPELIVPTSGTISIEILLYTKDDTGALVAPDSLPTITLSNAAGTNLSSRLGTVTSTGTTGKYKVIYTSSSAHALFDSLVWEAQYTASTKTYAIPQVSMTVDALADYFTSTDRAKLVSVFNVIPTSGLISSTDNVQDIIDSVGSPMQTGTKVVLNATQTDYIPATAAALATLQTTATAAAGSASTAATNTTQVPNLVTGTGINAKFTTKALENAPTGSGGGGGNAGSGDIAVNHDTGGADVLRVTHGGVGVDNVCIRAYLKADYDGGDRTVRAEAFTGTDGRWETDMMLDAGVYVLAFAATGYTIPNAEVTVSAN